MKAEKPCTVTLLTAFNLHRVSSSSCLRARRSKSGTVFVLKGEECSRTGDWVVESEKVFALSTSPKPDVAAVVVTVPAAAATVVVGVVVDAGWLGRRL